MKINDKFVFGILKLLYVFCCLLMYSFMNPPNLTAGNILESMILGLLFEIAILFTLAVLLIR